MIKIRTFEDIFKDFCLWLAKTTRNPEYLYEYQLKIKPKEIVNAFCYKSILRLCLDKENGLYYFFKFICGNLVQCGYPKPVRYNKLWRKWDRLVKEHKRLAILAARGHSKTTFFSIILNIYHAFISKHKKFLIVSSSQEQANRILNEIKIIIDNNEWLVQKKNPDRWSAETIGYNGGYFLVKGVGSEVRGEHVDRIIADDVLRSDNKISDQEIEDYVDMVLDPMLLARRGQMVVVGTPLSVNDIFSSIKQRIEEGSSWYMERFPAILDWDNKSLLCPDRFSWEDLMIKKATMGSLKFSREYQLEFYSRDISLFPEKVLRPALDKGKSYVLMKKYEKLGPEWTYLIGVDCARSGSASADYSVAIVLAYNTITNEKRVVRMWREKGLKISEQAERIASIAREFDNCFVLVEKNNMGQDVIDELADKWNVNVQGLTTGSNAAKKEELVRFLIVAFEQGHMIIPQGDEDTRREMSILVDELSKFCAALTPSGNETYRGSGAHDDSTMALVYANKATQLVGVPFAVSSESNLYSSLLTNKYESDLEQMMRIGIIK